MKRYLRTLKGFIRKELLQTLRDPRMRMMLFVAPLVQLVIFGVALSNEVKNIRFAAVYDSSDWLAQKVYQRSLASGWFVPARVSGSDPFEWVRSGQADAVMVTPPRGLSQEVSEKIHTGGAPLQLLVNAQNVLRAQGVEVYFKSILGEVFQDPQNPLLPTDSAPGLNFEVRTLFNPTMDTSMYMVPGVLSMLVCLITIILTSMSVAKEKEVGTYETLQAAPLHSWEILLGKMLPFILLGLVQVPLILAAAVLFFHLPVRGPLLELMGATFFFVVTTVSIGVLISNIARNQQQAMLGGFIFLFPAVLLSGLMFPLENMPLPMYWLAQINPLTHFIDLLRNILLKGGNGNYFLVHAGLLSLSALFCALLALRRSR